MCITCARTHICKMANDTPYMLWLNGIVVRMPLWINRAKAVKRL